MIVMNVLALNLKIGNICEFKVRVTNEKQEKTFEEAFNIVKTAVDEI